MNKYRIVERDIWLASQWRRAFDVQKRYLFFFWETVDMELTIKAAKESLQARKQGDYAKKRGTVIHTDV